MVIPSIFTEYLQDKQIVLSSAKKRWELVKVWLGRLLGGALVLLMIWQISQQNELLSWWSRLSASLQQPEQLFYLILAALLMPFNWWLEVAKWRQLLKNTWPLGWWAALRLVLAGISVSLATPNRIGEYGGRMLLAPSEQATNVVLSTLVGSLCQWLAFVLCGWPALVYWWGSRMGWPVGSMLLLSIVVVLLILLALLVLLHLLRRSERESWGSQYKWWRWLRREAAFLRQLNGRQLGLASLLALGRFLTYTLQYLLLLWFFGVPLTFWQGWSGIFCIYLIQAGIPLPPGLGVITRSEIALLVWSVPEVELLGVVIATFSLYLINLVLPAALGAVLLLGIEKKTPDKDEK